MTSSSRNKADVKKLFEFWCEVKQTSSDGSGSTYRPGVPEGVIIESFPQSFRDEKTISDIPAFAFPCDFESGAVQVYSFVLTTDDSKWRYGFCRHDARSNTTMVIITFLPWHDTFFRLLAVLAEIRRTTPGDFSTFLSEAYSAGLPNAAGHLTIFYEGGKNKFTIDRPLHFHLPSIPENQNLNKYYNFVPPKNMIGVFAAMLAERRIIFTSRHLDRLSACIQAANAFLYPMVWQHIYIPVMPMRLKDYLSAPMPYLIGVPQQVLNTMTPDELGDVVILNCDTRDFTSPFDDVHQMPADIVSRMKKDLSQTQDHMGDRVSRIFLVVLVQLIGGWRDAVEFRGAGKTFNQEKFIESRPSHLRPFLTKMMELQIFQQFIDERLEMLNTGLGFSDEFEMETVRYAEKMKRDRRNWTVMKNFKEKTNPAVRTAVKSVKVGSRGVKAAYKDLKSKFRDITPPNMNGPTTLTATNFRSHLSSSSQHDRIDGFHSGGNSNTAVGLVGHHSAPSSPIFSSKRSGSLGIGSSSSSAYQYDSDRGGANVDGELLNGSIPAIRRIPVPLAQSNSSAYIPTNGYATSAASSISHLGNHLASSPTISPASSLCSSEMNLSQELQNHPLFKTPAVNRSLKPGAGLELNGRRAGNGCIPPARPPPPAPHLLQAGPYNTASSRLAPVSYYNHPYVPLSQAQQKQQQQQQQQKLQMSISHPHVITKPPAGSRNMPSNVRKAQTLNQSSLAAAAAAVASQHRIITTDSSYDSPPDMLSPPVPPRRQPMPGEESGPNAVAMAAAAVHAGINRLERNCWQDCNDGVGDGRRDHRNHHHHQRLRNSSSSNTSSGSSSGSASVSGGSNSSSTSSSASFMSAASSFSHQQLQPQAHEAAAVPVSLPVPVPVPAPRLKRERESLRSLQPPTNSHQQSATAESSVTAVANDDDTMNDLISLDDSNNASFDLEDFDPLNQNARPLPSLSGGVGVGHTKRATTLPAGTTAASVINPLYSYMAASTTMTNTNNCKPPPLPTSAPPSRPPPDEDFELLRKYGLDQFTLTTTTMATAASQPTTMTTITTTPTPAMITSNGIGHVVNSNGRVATTNGMNNWTTFD